MRTHPLAVLLLCTLAPSVAAQRQLRANHPEIVAIRRVYNEIQEGMAALTLSSTDTSITCASDPYGSTIGVCRDSSGSVRALVMEGGTDDHAETDRFYYDRQGRLRFIFSSVGAVNGTTAELRQYYDSAGSEVRYEVRKLTGPGYPWAKVSPFLHASGWPSDWCP